MAFWPYFCTFSSFQSTLSMRRATTPYVSDDAIISISIHALHEESDRILGNGYVGAWYISIHALHEESDTATTCPARTTMHFNPRSP